MAEPDMLVIGAGVFGLSVALAAHRAGLKVRVLEAARIGAGASGGPVGALMPHPPGRWSALKAFQRDALLALPGWIDALRADTGRDVGYARTGRLTPLATQGARTTADAAAAAAPEVWPAEMRFEVLGMPPDGAPRFAPEAHRHGFVHETFSARLNPAAYLSALAAALPPSTVSEGMPVLGIDPIRGVVDTRTERFAARAVVVAAGHESWGLCPALVPGGAVKGQAALLALPGFGAPSLIHADGLFIVARGDHVAVGSTSERAWLESCETDAELDNLLERARTLCPGLAGGTVCMRWAGLRPRPPGRDPVLGRIPESDRLWIASGGYKIGLGIAHHAANAVVGQLTGDTNAPQIPESFVPQSNDQREISRTRFTSQGSA